MLNIAYSPAQIASDEMHELNNGFGAFTINDFGGLSELTIRGCALWLLYKLRSGYVRVSSQISTSSYDASTDSITVDVENCLYLEPGPLKVQAVLVRSSRNIIELEEEYFAGENEDFMIRSPVYEFYIKDSINAIESLIDPVTENISAAVKDYIDDLVTEIIAEGFQLDDHLDAGSNNAVQNRIVTAAINALYDYIDEHSGGGGGGGGTIDVDTKMLRFSEDAVQNKVITEAVRQRMLNKDIEMYDSSTVTFNSGATSIIYNKAGTSQLACYASANAVDVSDALRAAAFGPGPTYQAKDQTTNQQDFKIKIGINEYSAVLWGTGATRYIVVNLVPKAFDPSSSASYTVTGEWKLMQADQFACVMQFDLNGNRAVSITAYFPSQSGSTYSATFKVDGYGTPVVKEELPVDAALSNTSENPVQNKVVTLALNTHNHDSRYYKKSEIDAMMESVGRNIDMYSATIPSNTWSGSEQHFILDTDYHSLNSYEATPAQHADSSFISYLDDNTEISTAPQEIGVQVIVDTGTVSAYSIDVYTEYSGTTKTGWFLTYNLIDDPAHYGYFWVKKANTDLAFVIYIPNSTSRSCTFTSDIVWTTGEWTITIPAIDLARVAATGDYNDLINAPDPADYYTSSEVDAAIATAIGTAIGGSY